MYIPIPNQSQSSLSPHIFSEVPLKIPTHPPPVILSIPSATSQLTFEVLVEAVPKAGRSREGRGPQPWQVLQDAAQAGGTAEATALHQDLEVKKQNGGGKMWKKMKKWRVFVQVEDLIDLLEEFVGNVSPLLLGRWGWSHPFSSGPGISSTKCRT